MAHLESGADPSVGTESSAPKPDLRRYFDGNGEPVDDYQAYLAGTAPSGRFSGFETAPVEPSGFRLMGRQHADGASKTALLGHWSKSSDGQLVWSPVEPKVQKTPSQDVARNDVAIPHIDAETGKPVIPVHVTVVRESGNPAFPSVPSLSDGVRQRIEAVLTSPSS